MSISSYDGGGPGGAGCERFSDQVWVVAIVLESNRCVVMCIKSHVMCESGWGSGASKLWIQVVSIGNMYGK